MKTTIKKNITFIVLLVLIITLLKDFSIYKLLINYTATFILAVMYYTISAIVTLYLEEKAQKLHEESIKRKQEEINNSKTNG